MIQCIDRTIPELYHFVSALIIYSTVYIYTATHNNFIYIQKDLEFHHNLNNLYT